MNSKFLTLEERTIIQRFLEKGVPTPSLIELKKSKSAELLLCLDSQVPNQKITWRTFLINNHVPCPLDVLIKKLGELVADTELPQKIEKGRHYPAARDPRLSLLEELDSSLNVHGYPCKCCPDK